MRKGQRKCKSCGTWVNPIMTQDRIIPRYHCHKCDRISKGLMVGKNEI